MVKAGIGPFPEYSYPYRFEQLRRFGFSFMYGGSFNSASDILLQFANTEVGMNWYAACLGYYKHHEKELQKWFKTGKKEYLIRKPCSNALDFKVTLPAKEPEFAPFCTRHLFQLGDEMSMTRYQNAIDFCFCTECLSGFRSWLRQRGWTLDRLNRVWKTSYKDWDEVMPQTFNETLFQPSPAGYVAHRLYMDKVFADSLGKIREKIREKYPLAMAGPTGVLNTPHTYGGNWNFRNMSVFECGSFYGAPRIPVSFDREKRFVMRFYGYENPQGVIRSNIWEGLLLGERNSNHWFGPIFLLPDLRLSQVRDYYRTLLWQLRSGPGDLLYHAVKYTDQAAILHSQESVIANFLKLSKADYSGKEFAFARVLEDLGIGYRFIAPDELSPEFLRKFKLLILPEASALKDRDIALIRDFVKNGGKLIADYEPTTMDENCVSRSVPALNSIFGIETGRQVLRKVKSHDLTGITINNALSGVVCKAGIPKGTATTKRRKIPLAIQNGNALYLNFEPLYASRREKAFRDLIDRFVQLPSPARFYSDYPVMHGYFRQGKILHIGLLAEPGFAGWQTSDPVMAARHRIAGKLKLASSAHLYDSRQGKYLGRGKDFTLSLVPSDGTLLSALPYQVKGIRLDFPEQITAGQTGKLSAEIEIVDGSSPENHVLLMRVYRPDGMESLEHRRIRLAKAGKYQFLFPSALNEKGQWKFTVTDAATGISKSCRITVE